MAEGDEGGGDVVIEPQVLSLDLMKPALKGLARTVDGTGYALTHLEIRGKNLGDISAISLYKHIRYLDLSTNEISDLSPLQSLEHLLSLNLSKNKIASLQLPALQFLQVPYPPPPVQLGETKDSHTSQLHTHVCGVLSARLCCLCD